MVPSTHNETTETQSDSSRESLLISDFNTSDRMDKILSIGCVVVAFLLPLKLALTYIALIPLLIVWIATQRDLIPRLLHNLAFRSVVAPLAFFVCAAAVSSVAGLSFSHSAPALLSLAFFSITLALFASHAQPITMCTALMCGQTLAALHSVIDAIFPGTLPSFFLGKVTESGQLAITLIATLGAVLALEHHARPIGRTSKELKLISITSTVALISISFRADTGASSSILILTSLALAFCMSFGTFHALRSRPGSRLIAIAYSTAIPLMVTALVVNLKRGPWIGTLVAVSIFLLPHTKKAVIGLAVSACSVAYFVGPVRDRLLASYDHFTISGGRSTIWRIGVELASEYPLGIGYHNSGILRQFAPEIPPELKHFHNNVINIAAEMGWLGLAIFLWFVISAIRMCWSDRRDTLSIAIGCALISWQVAGLVEYNFGDSEITILVWALLGVALGKKLKEARQNLPVAQ